MSIPLRVAKSDNVLRNIHLKNVNQLVQRDPVEAAVNALQRVARVKNASIVSLLRLFSRLPNLDGNIGAHGRPSQLVDTQSTQNGTNVAVVDESVCVDILLLLAQDGLKAVDNLANEEALGGLDILDGLRVVAPVVVPLPVTSTEDFLGLDLGHALGGVGEAAGKLVSVAEAGLEVVGEVVKGALPRTAGGAENVSQRLPEVSRHAEMLVPFGGGLDGRQNGVSGIAAIAIVDGVGTGLLMKRHSARVMRPESTQDTSSTLLGESRGAGSQPDFVVGTGWDQAKLPTVQSPEVLAVLDTIKETASGQLREEAGRVDVRQSIHEWVARVRVDVGKDLSTRGAAHFASIQEGFKAGAVKWLVLLRGSCVSRPISPRLLWSLTSPPGARLYMVRLWCRWRYSRYTSLA